MYNIVQQYYLIISYFFSDYRNNLVKLFASTKIHENEFRIN